MCLVALADTFAVDFLDSLAVVESADLLGFSCWHGVCEQWGEMKIPQFNLSDFNPDCMTVEEMHQWIGFIGNGRRPQVAKQWFAGMKGQFGHARNVRNYLWNKIAAVNLRLDGQIARAMEYEAICDRIYSQLPDCAKW